MNELALFAGAGGGLLATHHILGWRCVGYVEMAEYPCKQLEARINDGLLPKAPIFYMHTSDFIKQGWPEKYRGLVNVVTAGFPCQPFAIGGLQRGMHDSRNGWPDTFCIVGKIRPEWVFLENSPNLLSVQHGGRTPPYIQQIAGDLASIGYDAEWGCLSASTLGADHKRKRVWIAAYSRSQGRQVILRSHERNSTTHHAQQTPPPITLDAVWSRLSRLEERLGEPAVFRDDDGLANRVDRLEAIGNGQVPAVAAEAWRLLGGKL